MDSRKKGILYMITASLSFAVMAVMVKLSGGIIPLFQQVFFRNLVMLIFSGYMVVKGNISLKPQKGSAFILFLRCFLGFMGVVCVFYANNHLALSDAQILQKLNPFFVILCAVFLLGEKLTLRKIITVAVGFAGAVVIINPTGNFELFPSLVGVLSAFFGGMAYLMIGMLKGKAEGPAIMFWFSLFSFVTALPLMLSDYISPEPAEWIYLILIGVFAAMGQYFITKSYLNAPASEITIYDYSGVILSPILGLLIFGETIHLRTIIGMIIIIGAGYAAAYFKKDNSKAENKSS